MAQPPNNNDLIQRVIIETDEQKAKAAIDRLTELKKAQAEVVRAAADGSKSYADARKEVNKLEKEHKSLSKSLSDEQQEYLKQNRLLDEYEQQVEDTAKANRELARSFGEVADSRRSSIGQRGADVAGDLASSTAGIRGGLSAVGFEGASGILEFTEAIADFGEFVPQLAGQVVSLGQGIQLAGVASTGLSGGVAGLASTAGAAIASVTGMSAAVASLLVVAAPVAIAVGLAAVAFANAAAAAEDQRKALEATIDAQRRANEAVASGLTTEEAEARIEELKRLREGEAQTLGTLRGAYDSMADQLGILTGAVQLFDSREEELANQINESQATVAGYDAEIRALENSMDNGALAANDEAIALEASAEATEKRIASLDQERLATERNAQAALAQSERITQQIADAESQRAKAQADAAEVAGLEEEIEGRKRVEAAQKHQDKLTQIQADGNAKLEELQAGFTELAAERGRTLQDADDKGTKDLNKLRGAFYAKQIAATEKFARETEKIEGQRAKEIKRITEDTLQSQRKAAIANDVEAFLNATEQGNLALSRAQESAADSEKERVDELIRQRDEERKAFQERQQEILNGIAEEKQRIVDSFNERRQALSDQIDAERKAIDERLKAERDSEAERLKQQAQNDEDTRRREDIRAQQQERNHNERIRQLEEERQKQLQLHEQELQALQQLTTTIQQLQQRASAPVQQPQRSSTASSYDRALTQRGSVYDRSAYTSGRQSSSVRRSGIFHAGGVTLLPPGVKEGIAIVTPEELIVPGGKTLPMAERAGLESSIAQRAMGVGAGMPQINFAPTFYNQIGEITSPSEVSQAIDDSNRTMLTELNNMISRRTG